VGLPVLDAGDGVDHRETPSASGDVCARGGVVARLWCPGHGCRQRLLAVAPYRSRVRGGLRSGILAGGCVDHRLTSTVVNFRLLPRT